MKLLRLLPLSAAIALGALSGCASPSDRYYTLDDAHRARSADAAAAPASGFVIEVLPVAVPERLARPQMLVRKAADSPELQVLEQHRWSSSFESELRDAVAMGIADRLGALDVSKAPRTGSGPVWRITVQVRRFDLVETRGVDAAFAWTVRRSDAADSLTCLSQETVSAGPGIDALADGARQATAHLVEAIAGAIGSAPAGSVMMPRCPKPVGN